MPGTEETDELAVDQGCTAIADSRQFNADWLSFTNVRDGWPSFANFENVANYPDWNVAGLVDCHQMVVIAEEAKLFRWSNPLKMRVALAPAVEKSVDPTWIAGDPDDDPNWVAAVAELDKAYKLVVIPTSHPDGPWTIDADVFPGFPNNVEYAWEDIIGTQGQPGRDDRTFTIRVEEKPYEGIRPPYRVYAYPWEDDES